MIVLFFALVTAASVSRAEAAPGDLPSKAYSAVFYKAAEGNSDLKKEAKAAYRDFNAFAKDKGDKIAALVEWDKLECEKLFRGSCDEKPRAGLKNGAGGS